MRKNSLVIHGVPEDAYTSTEEVVIHLGEIWVYQSSWRTEISHKFNTRNKPIIVKFLSHKVKSKVEKRRVMLKRIKASDILPSASVSVALNRKPRIFINENLTSYWWSIIKKANNMRKDGWVLSYYEDGLVQSVWTLDGKVRVKTSPDGSLVRICVEDFDNL